MKEHFDVIVSQDHLLRVHNHGDLLLNGVFLGLWCMLANLFLELILCEEGYEVIGKASQLQQLIIIISLLFVPCISFRFRRKLIF